MFLALLQWYSLVCAQFSNCTVPFLLHSGSWTKQCKIGQPGCKTILFAELTIAKWVALLHSE
jgi:hypothetical protein